MSYKTFICCEWNNIIDLILSFIWLILKSMKTGDIESMIKGEGWNFEHSNCRMANISNLKINERPNLRKSLQ